MLNHNRGQSLIEVLVVLAITTLVVLALVITVLTGLKNSQFAQSQTKATKLAQEAMEKVKAIRDRNEIGKFSFSYTGGTVDEFNDVWDLTLTDHCPETGGYSPCYFRLDPPNLVLDKQGINGYKELIGDGFYRQIVFEDTTIDFDKEKKVTVKIFWTDSSGEHESNLQTILTNYQ